LLRRILFTAVFAAASFNSLTVPQASAATTSVRQYLADGFDFPVGKPDGYGYYKARGFWPNGHLGEDWNGRGGGNSDLGDPVYAIGGGVVVYSADYRSGWGNVIIIRHAYRESDGMVRYIDSLYGHLDRRLVKLDQLVKRGQQIGTIGTNHGMYLAHLHLEIRRNLSIGMARSNYKKDYSNYYSPTDFIKTRRKLRTGFRQHPIPVNTFGDGVSQPSSPKLVVPLEKPPSSLSRDSAVAKTRVPEEVEKVLKEHEKPATTTTKGFWQSVKERLRFRPSSASRD
jgi:murein DD-endopeptidase MepM/ murein hydrolase activator NlpD